MIDRVSVKCPQLLEDARFFPIRRQLRGERRSPFRVLFTKDLKGRGSHADKGCVSTLAHTMMTAARPAESGLAGPGELDRYPYAESPGADRVSPPPGTAPTPSWAGSAAARQAAGAADCTANSFNSLVR